jgi:hypothetical protein
MAVSAAKNLLADIKRLLDSAREDYSKNRLDNHSYYVSELNALLKRARDLTDIEIPDVKAAENDEVVHTSHTVGMPYDPEVIPSYGSKTRKLREVTNVADKLFNEISTAVEIDSQKNSKKARSISQLQKLMGTIDTLKAGRRHSDEFDIWKREVEVAIEQIFPKDSRHLKDLSISYYPSSTYAFGLGTREEPSEREYQNAYIAGLDKARLVIQSMVKEIETYWPDESAQETSKSTGETIELICNRFHTVVRQLKKRRKGRTVLEVKDEYDVQDLMRVLLHLFFDDIRPEEVTPSYAGKSARVDFLLKVEKTVLEIKHGRTNLTEKELGDELIIDIRRYKETHPDCESLYCFVYDPEGYIDNPRGMENDLSQVTEGMPVKVIIAPKTH